MTNNQNVNIVPEAGSGAHVADTQRRQINQALNRPVPAFPSLQTVNTDTTGGAYTIPAGGGRTLVLTGGLAAVVTFPLARENSHQIIRLLLKNMSGLPTLRNIETDNIDPLPAGALSVVYQSDGLKTWHLIDAYVGVVTPLVLGLRGGFRWPANGEDITITDADFGIFGNSARRAHNITFPLASSLPGKLLLFSYAPSGSLIPSGSDTVDSYLHDSAWYQSDGVSRWFRMESV